MTSLGREGAFEHEALVYDSDAAYVATLAPLLVDAVTAGRPAVAVVPPRNAELLRAATGARGDAVEYLDADQWYRRPTSVILAYHGLLCEFGPHADPFVVGEVRFGDTERDWERWIRYESVVNHAFAHHAARVVCPYDRRLLPPTVLEHAACTHPHLLDGHGPYPSDRYVDAATFLARSKPVLAVPSGRPHADVLVEGLPREGRRAFARAATEAGFRSDRIDDLSVAVNEILTNALVHGGGTAWFRVWAGPDAITCVVEDDGPGAGDVLLGYRPPAADAGSGYGMWLARQLFDDVELSCLPTGGLRVVLAASA